MDNDLQSQYVARSVAHEWITNPGRERVKLERWNWPGSNVVKALRRLITSS
jgi:hypothetical protein